MSMLRKDNDSVHRPRQKEKVLVDAEGFNEFSHSWVGPFVDLHSVVFPDGATRSIEHMDTHTLHFSDGTFCGYKKITSTPRGRQEIVIRWKPAQ